MAKKTKIPFKQIIEALLDADKPFPPRYLYRLSDLPQADFEQLKDTWPRLSTRRRQAILEDIADLSEDDYLLDFSNVSWIALTDPDPEVRSLALKALAEYEQPELAPVLIKMVVKDSDVNVRAEAARAFSPFVFLGEVEELPEETFHEIEDCLLKILKGTDAAMVKRRAMEALGYSSFEEVSPIIQAAYDLNDKEWLVSSLLAMGRSGDPKWSEQVIRKLDDARPAVQAEAVTSAGELELHETLQQLKDLLTSDEDEVRAAAIWSLSQIGGEGVREALEALLDSTEDDEEADLIEAALENLEFADGEGMFSLIDLSELEGMDEDADVDASVDEDVDADASMDEDEDQKPKRPAQKK